MMNRKGTGLDYNILGGTEEVYEKHKIDQLLRRLFEPGISGTRRHYTRMCQAEIRLRL
jgi:hypothetical protein